MHGIRTNSRFTTFKSNTHDGLNDDNHSDDIENERPESFDKRAKSVFGHTMDDVEKQILDWQEELKYIKNTP